MKTFNLQLWRETPGYQAELDTFLKSPAGKAFMETLHAETPVAPPVVDNVNALTIAGRTAQHLAVLRRIASMSELSEPTAENERADYSEEPL